MKNATVLRSVIAAFSTAILMSPLTASADGCDSRKYMQHSAGNFTVPAADILTYQGSEQAAYVQHAAYRGEGKLYKMGHHGMKETAMANTDDLVDTAVKAGSFNTLVAAVKAADLVDTLKGDGPFTIFAPTDEAFAKIPAEQLQALLADKEALTKVLTYHVVEGKVTSSEVVKLASAKTVQGSSVSIKTTDGVMIDNAKVIKTDIEASNGIIHVIDTVIMPN